MKNYTITVLFAFSAILGFTQENMDSNNPVKLRSGTEFYPNNILDYITSDTKEKSISGRYYKFVQFNSIPSQSIKEQMIAAGMRFQEYIPMNTYLVSFPSSFSKKTLQNYNIKSIVALKNTDRITELAISQPYPTWAIEETNLILYLSFYEDLNFESCLEKLMPNIVELKSKTKSVNKVLVSVNPNNIKELLNLDFIRLVDLTPEPGKPEHDLSRNMHRSTSINTRYPTGRKYDGRGIVVVNNDDGHVGPHIDFTGRLSQPTATITTGTHGDMTGGIIAGCGNLDPTMSGMATGCDLIVQDYASNLPNTVAYHTNDSAVIFSSSYSNGCNAGYTSLSRTVDQQIRQNPTMIQVFSAGNSNNNTCGGNAYGAGNQWANITGGHKQAKNVIATANLFTNTNLINSSSRGPANDGRIKPDISANGNGNITTDPNNTYATGGGTSAACPGISGVLAQMYQAYEDNNSGVRPESGLMKAIILNTAKDFGNVGPDFKFGWGRVDALRAAKAIEDTRYFSSTISNGGNNSHSIVIPANVKEVKVMVYWHDYEASTAAVTDLVNDLDIKMELGLTTFLPWRLDPTPNITALNSPATKGVDSLNNVEQVSIINPTAGTYILRIAGTSVPQGPQKYFVTYEYLMDEVKLVNPNGGEGFVPGITERLFWDTYGTSSNFTLSYSVDSGSSWTGIGVSGATSRFRDWTVPNIVSGTALVRIVSGSRTDISDHTFSIINKPTNLRIDTVCPKFMVVSWNPVAGADEYQLFLLGNKYMDSVGRTTSTQFRIPITNPLVEQWFSVAAIKQNGDGNLGRRANAVFYPGGLLNCVLPLDAGVSSFLGPDTTSCLIGPTNINVRVSNYGVSSFSGLSIKYQVNGGSIQSGTLSATLSPSSSTVFSFPTPYSFTTAGIYTIKAWTELSGELFELNDTMTYSFDFTPVYSIPYFENFNSFTDCSTGNGCEAVLCPLSKGFLNFENGVDDDIDWRVNSGNTPSNNTGPSGDHTPGTGKYLYLEATGSCDDKKGTLKTPCIDLGSSSSPVLTFWYYLYGETNGGTMDTLYVDVFDGTSWQLNEFKIGGNQGNLWRRGDIVLTSYIGKTINLRFRGSTGSSWDTDMAIDDIAISNLTSIDETELSNSVSVFPNPNNGEFNISIDNAKINSLEITVYDMYGRLVHQERVTNKINLIKLNNVSAGVYSVRINGADQTTIKKIVIN